jgi:uncharacterized membrane protein
MVSFVCFCFKVAKVVLLLHMGILFIKQLNAVLISLLQFGYYIGCCQATEDFYPVV